MNASFNTRYDTLPICTHTIKCSFEIYHPWKLITSFYRPFISSHWLLARSEFHCKSRTKIAQCPRKSIVIYYFILSYFISFKLSWRVVELLSWLIITVGSMYSQYQFQLLQSQIRSNSHISRDPSLRRLARSLSHHHHRSSTRLSQFQFKRETFFSFSQEPLINRWNHFVITAMWVLSSSAATFQVLSAVAVDLITTNKKKKQKCV